MTGASSAVYSAKTSGAEMITWNISKSVVSVISAGLVAGGLVVGGVGMAGAQGGPTHEAGCLGQHDASMMPDMSGDQHAEMLAKAADALGLSVDELRTQLEAGKCMPQIAEVQGVDLDVLHAELHNGG